MTAADPPSIADLAHRITMLEHQITTILVLSALNLFANLATIAVAVLAVIG